MGETSKKRGEFGEEIVFKLLQLIGWNNSLTNRDIPCINGNKHAISTSPRQSHGIDFIYSYKCPLFTDTKQLVLISSKLTDSYKANPVSLFKQYLSDLANAIDCFKVSQIRNTLKDTSFGVDHKHSGVIFWLDNTSNYDDVIDRLTDFKVECDSEFDSIYLVDNKRAMFLFDTITFIKNFFQKATIEFFHPNTGYNTTIQAKVSSSNILPVQYINSSILPLKVIDSDNSEYLILNCIDEFEIDYLRRLISVAHSLTEGWGQKIFILFPEFNKNKHNDFVETVKLEFNDQKFTSKVHVSSFNPNFRNVESI